jgi:hypothetical protein
LAEQGGSAKFRLEPLNGRIAPEVVVPGRCAVFGTRTSWVGAKLKHTVWKTNHADAKVRGAALFGPAESLQVEAVPVVELDAFLLQQALLADVAAMAGEGVGHLALRVDDAMPGNIGCRVEVL